MTAAVEAPPSPGVESLLALSRAGGDAPAWLAGLRHAAREAFAERGFPGPREEDWRYTSTASLSAASFTAPPTGDAVRAAADALAATLGPLDVRRGKEPRLVFLNGRLEPTWSSAEGLPAGVRLASLAAEPSLGEALLPRALDTARLPLATLNAAFLLDGALLRVPRGVVVEAPIHLLFLTVPAADGAGRTIAVAPRAVIALEDGAQATIVETHAGASGPAFASPVTDAALGRSAVLHHHTLQLAGEDTSHLGLLSVRQERDSQLHARLFSLGGRLVRNETHVLLDGGGAGCTLDGLFCGAGGQQVDNHTVIDHARPHGSSQELYKGILGGRARGAFDGKIVVRKHAAKTDAHQKNRNLLLSGDAQVDSKPQLEIDNNDVRCTHGSATGQLDPDALFYLRSRGLDVATARGLLTLAFGSELTGRVGVPALRSFLEGWLLSWLPRDGKE